MRQQTLTQKVCRAFALALLACTFGFAAVPAAASALPLAPFAAATCAHVTDSSNDTVTAGTGMTCIFEDYVNPFIKFLTGLVGIAVIISVIWGGILYQTSAGDSGKVAAAKGRIYQAIIALVIFLFLIAALEWLIPGGINGNGS